MKSTISQYIKVKKSKIHCTGVFAKKNIPKGTKIIEYVGKKLTKKQSDKAADRDITRNKKNKKNGAVYIFELNKKYDIDGNVPYNTAKLINHSCNPNCEADIIKNHIWIIALKNIKKGEEISYDYSYEFDIEDLEDHPCRCGAKNCDGYIVDRNEWPKMYKALKKAKKKK